jgi:dynamin 1-like protein
VEFTHQPGKKYQGYLDVRKEIEEETQRKAGTNMGITKDSLFLRVYSANVLNITVVDLPGLVKVIFFLNFLLTNFSS